MTMNPLSLAQIGLDASTADRPRDFYENQTNADLKEWLGRHGYQFLSRDPKAALVRKVIRAKTIREWCAKAKAKVVGLASPEHRARIALVPTSIRVARQVVDGNWEPTGHDALMFARAIVAMADAWTPDDADGYEVQHADDSPHAKAAAKAADQND